MRRFNKWVDDRLANRDRRFMEATARNAAREALHYYTCVRTIAQWREILDEAEKAQETYQSMADLIVKAGFHHVQ